MAKKNSFKKHGVLLVDKPVGMSSAHLVGKIKRISGAKKVGHSGTLDPFAGGLMILGINNGTRLSQFFLTGDKSYRAEITFGTETDTLDSTGETVRTSAPDFFEKNPSFFSEESLTLLLEGFKGEQLQKPPVYSALKHNGVPLYKLAREGNPVEKEARSIVIHRLDLIRIAPPAITVDVCCSKGTYVRSLAADIGEKAGCGAHLSALSRTESCGFYLSNACSPDTLSSPEAVEAALIPMDDALPGVPSFTAGGEMTAKIRNGISVSYDPEFLAVASGQRLVKIVDRDRNLVAVLEFDKNEGKHNYCCVFHD
jgi:tRNA pseudouridine55 synthase